MRQGCLLSPDIFNLFLENILTETCIDLGINVDGYKLKDLHFADDIALIADSKIDLRTLVERVHEASKKYVMKISIPKTKAMVFSYEEHLLIDINLVCVCVYGDVLLCWQLPKNPLNPPTKYHFLYSWMPAKVYLHLTAPWMRYSWILCGNKPEFGEIDLHCSSGALCIFSGQSHS